VSVLSVPARGIFFKIKGAVWCGFPCVRWLPQRSLGGVLGNPTFRQVIDLTGLIGLVWAAGRCFGTAGLRRIAVPRAQTLL
jgi:hypothetical protein